MFFFLGRHFFWFWKDARVDGFFAFDVVHSFHEVLYEFELNIFFQEISVIFPTVLSPNNFQFFLAADDDNVLFFLFESLF